MDEMREIERLIAPALEAMGFSLVRVRLFGGKRRRLQVMAERSDGTGMTVDHCAEVSRGISAILDVADPLPGSYVLEVSSPGIDRPLVRIGDFERFSGFEARVEVTRPIEGRRRFRGTLLGVARGTVRIALDGGVVDLPFEDIVAAKLVMSEALIEASLKRRDM